MARIKTILRVTSSGVDSNTFWKWKGLWTSATALPTDYPAGSVIKFSVDCVVPYLGGDVTYSAGSKAVSFAANSGTADNWLQF